MNESFIDSALKRLERRKALYGDWGYATMEAGLRILANHPDALDKLPSQNKDAIEKCLMDKSPLSFAEYGRRNGMRREIVSFHVHKGMRHLKRPNAPWNANTP